MLNKILKSLLLGVFVLALSSSIVSCQKAKDTIGVIIVKDSSGALIEGATVTLSQDGLISPQGLETDPEINKEDITDANGRAEFTYNLEAILNVSVQKIDGNNILTGDEVIRLLKEKTVTKVVEIN